MLPRLARVRAPLTLAATGCRLPSASGRHRTLGRWRRFEPFLLEEQVCAGTITAEVSELRLDVEDAARLLDGNGNIALTGLRLYAFCRAFSQDTSKLVIQPNQRLQACYVRARRQAPKVLESAVIGVRRHLEASVQPEPSHPYGRPSQSRGDGLTVGSACHGRVLPIGTAQASFGSASLPGCRGMFSRRSWVRIMTWRGVGPLSDRSTAG
jgi:hypothetical protein